MGSFGGPDPACPDLVVARDGVLGLGLGVSPLLEQLRVAELLFRSCVALEQVGERLPEPSELGWRSLSAPLRVELGEGAA